MCCHPSGFLPKVNSNQFSICNNSQNKSKGPSLELYYAEEAIGLVKALFWNVKSLIILLPIGSDRSKEARCGVRKSIRKPKNILATMRAV